MTIEKEQLHLDAWNELSAEGKIKLVESIIQASNIPFKIKKTEVFKQNGQNTQNEQNNVQVETVVLEYEKSQFVFVPGKRNVTLGWDTKTCVIGESVKQTIKDELEIAYDYDLEAYHENIDYIKELIEKAEQNKDFDKLEKLKAELNEELEEKPKKKTFEEWEAYIQANTSPERTVDISPMIAEVTAEYIEYDTTYNKFMDILEKSNFSIPTEDEWEYLCGGGTRTLFRWGDFLEKPMNEIYNNAMSEGLRNYYGAEEESILDSPNMFGLLIANDTYKYELVSSDCLFKGADGGCSVCGGDGIFYTAPILSTFFVPGASTVATDEQDRKLIRNYFSYRRIVRLD